LRNLLAHYPSWIEPVNDHETKLTVGLRLFIADRIHQWEVDTPQATHWAEMLSFVRASPWRTFGVNSLALRHWGRTAHRRRPSLSIETEIPAKP
jgi:hypothetical protein